MPQFFFNGRCKTFSGKDFFSFFGKEKSSGSKKAIPNIENPCCFGNGVILLGDQLDRFDFQLTGKISAFFCNGEPPGNKFTPFPWCLPLLGGSIPLDVEGCI